MGVVDFNRELYQEMCEEMKVLIEEEKELARRKEDLRKKLLDMAGGERMEYGIKITAKESLGPVDYKQIVEHHLDLPEEALDHYRKPPRKFWEIRSYE